MKVFYRQGKPCHRTCLRLATPLHREAIVFSSLHDITIQDVLGNALQFYLNKRKKETDAALEKILHGAEKTEIGSKEKRPKKMRDTGIEVYVSIPIPMWKEAITLASLDDITIKNVLKNALEFYLRKKKGETDASLERIAEKREVLVQDIIAECIKEYKHRSPYSK